jgi:hypothetical protein
VGVCRSIECGHGMVERTAASDNWQSMSTASATSETLPESSQRLRPSLGWGPLVAGLLLLANVIVPLLWGDVYPFTSAPMFRDNPQACCNYRVLGPNGEQLPAEDWLCHRIYDGNPLGYGVGRQPPPVLEQTFGEVHDEATIRAHIRKLLLQPERDRLPYVEVEQDIIGPLRDDPERVGVQETRRFRVKR